MQFSQIVSQHPSKQHVLASIKAGKLPHALLLCGNQGIGKLPFATAIAQYMNCLNPTETDSCGTCTHCKKISQGIHPDVHYVLPIISAKQGDKPLLTDHYWEEFRGAFLEDAYYSFEQWQEAQDGQNKQLSINVEEIREAKRKLQLKTFEAKYKVLIIWNVEKINLNGANAFLKLLEEPPEKTLLLMTCADPSRLLTTINSRCQRLFLDRLTVADIAHYLTEHNQISATQAEAIARISEGSIRNAKTYITASGMKQIQLYIDWLRACYSGNYASIQQTIEPIVKSAKEFQKSFLSLAMKKMRDSFLFHLDMKDLALATEEEAVFHQKFSPFLSPEKVQYILQELENSQRYLTQNANASMVFSALSLKLFFILKEKI